MPTPLHDTTAAGSVKVIHWHLDEDDSAGDGESSVRRFVNLSLITGELTVSHADAIPPWSVWVCHELRWPIAYTPAKRVNTLLDRLAPYAQRLMRSIETGATREGTSSRTVLSYPSGLALDAIQRLCADTWTDPPGLPASEATE
ncbi:hypothetical protein [Streptomyces sp. NPDC048636]|uniref:hypothetical protein n=1 Tax=Streptomyces sp. NPDC048636 TaxID=3155762 RepID=UPI003444F3BE